MTLEHKIIEFVKPYYAEKDLMHNLGHIERVLKQSSVIGKNYEYDINLLTCGAYLHGVINEHFEEVNSFLKEQTSDSNLITKILECAKESDKSSAPVTIEGKILHDAHVLEGGIYYSIIKSLITGSIRGQSLKETINYYKDNIVENRKCFLPESSALLELSNEKCKEILADLENYI